MNFGNKAPALCLWCCDLLSLDGVQITPLLADLVAMVGAPTLGSLIAAFVQGAAIGTDRG